MRPDRRTLKVIAIVLVWAGLARGAILHWSPYPATLDGFFYLRSLELLSASGTLPRNAVMTTRSQSIGVGIVPDAVPERGLLAHELPLPVGGLVLRDPLAVHELVHDAW